MSDELKPLPCPFCGGQALSMSEGSTFRWRVLSCDCCGANAGETRIKTAGEGTQEDWAKDCKAEAIAAWNRRAQPAAPTVLECAGIKPIPPINSATLVAPDAASSVAPEPPNPWKDAVIDGLVVSWALKDGHETNPRQALADLIDAETHMALDPAISERARALVESGAHPPRAPLTRDEIRSIFLANGFTIKEGCDDLKEYVYEAAFAVEARLGAGVAG